MTIERRFLFGPEVELRIDETGTGPRISGHAAVFNQRVSIFPGEDEMVRPGAFAKTIAEADVRGLFNHDPNFVLGRNRAGTLTLSEDQTGLAYTIQAPSTDLVRDLVLEPMRRGDISGSSFGFEVIQQKREAGLRELLEVRLWDVGPVTFPAYPTAESAVRSLFADCTSEDELAFFASLRSSGLTSADVEAMIKRKAELADERGSQSEPTSGGWDDQMRQKLRLLAAGA